MAREGKRKKKVFSNWEHANTQQWEKCETPPSSTVHIFGTDIGPVKFISLQSIPFSPTNDEVWSTLVIEPEGLHESYSTPPQWNVILTTVNMYNPIQSNSMQFLPLDWWWCILKLKDGNSSWVSEPTMVIMWQWCNGYETANTQNRHDKDTNIHTRTP